MSPLSGSAPLDASPPGSASPTGSVSSDGSEADPDGTAAPSPTTLHACLLSGGASRRMGRDKALLPHPHGGTWLEGTLRLLSQLERPITLLSRHPSHLRAAAALAPDLAVPLDSLLEDGPSEGPLEALRQLMEQHPDASLLLCPVDMPWLDLDSLRALVGRAQHEPERIHVAHDGERLQPLLGLYPTDRHHRRSLAAFLAPGGRSLQRWLGQVGHNTVPLPAGPMRNCNHPADWGDGSPPVPAP